VEIRSRFSYGSTAANTVTHGDLISKLSKSARKREHLALQALGEQLIELTPEQLGGLDLDARLLDAVIDARSMRAHGALRRQKQLIGKLMRNVDPAPLRAALDALGRDDRMTKRIFREAEQWRDRITGEEPDALAAFFTYLGHTSKALESASTACRAAVDEKARKLAKRRIFRAIHREIELKVQNDPRNS